LLQKNSDTVPVDSIDPDDSGPMLSVTLKQSPYGETYALPAAQPEQTSGRCSDTGDQSKAPQSTPVAPAMPDLLDPVVLRTMPAKVAAFMMYEPADRPPWRTETTGQREEREFFEELGSWCG
jgi:hypothetical protein